MIQFCRSVFPFFEWFRISIQRDEKPDNINIVMQGGVEICTLFFNVPYIKRGWGCVMKKTNYVGYACHCTISKAMPATAIIVPSTIRTDSRSL